MAVPSRLIELDCFNVGERLKCVYKAPDKGRCTINLKTSNNAIVLHHDVRYEWGNGWKNTLVLNTLPAGGSWGTEEHPEGFNFMHGKKVKVNIIAGDNGFNIYCYGKFITTYTYRSGLTAAAVKKIEWSFEDNGATIKPDLKCFKVAYK